MPRRQKTPAGPPEFEERTPTESKSSRVRIALAGVLVILFALLVVIVGFVMNLLAPVGTSGEVMPAALLPWTAADRGATVIEANTAPTASTAACRRCSVSTALS